MSPSPSPSGVTGCPLPVLGTAGTGVWGALFPLAPPSLWLPQPFLLPKRRRWGPLRPAASSGPPTPFVGDGERRKGAGGGKGARELPAPRGRRGQPRPRGRFGGPQPRVPPCWGSAVADANRLKPLFFGVKGDEKPSPGVRERRREDVTEPIYQSFPSSHVVPLRTARGGRFVPGAAPGEFGWRAGAEPGSAGVCSDVLGLPGTALEPPGAPARCASPPAGASTGPALSAAAGTAQHGSPQPPRVSVKTKSRGRKMVGRHMLCRCMTWFCLR